MLWSFQVSVTWSARRAKEGVEICEQDMVDSGSGRGLEVWVVRLGVRGLVEQVGEIGSFHIRYIPLRMEGSWSMRRWCGRFTLYFWSRGF